MLERRGMDAKLTIGFLGAGKMAAALAKGFVKGGLVKPGQILASDPAEAARTAFVRETGARATAANAEAVKFGRVIVLAVKPGCVKELLAEVREQITPGHLVISIAAGVTLGQLEGNLGQGARVIRAMPNTPALLGASASAFARGRAATAEDAVLTQRLLAAVGLVFELKEPLLDAVTGLSGSGPAYIYAVIEALSDGGVAAGLPREVADETGGANGAGRRPHGFGNRPASRRAQRHGNKPRRHHHRRAARIGKGRVAGRPDQRGARGGGEGGEAGKK